MNRKNGGCKEITHFKTIDKVKDLKKDRQKTVATKSRTQYPDHNSCLRSDPRCSKIIKVITVEAIAYEEAHNVQGRRWFTRKQSASILQLTRFEHQKMPTSPQIPQIAPTGSRCILISSSTLILGSRCLGVWLLSLVRRRARILNMRSRSARLRMRSCAQTLLSPSAKCRHMDYTI